jgi:hypothetical protein
MGKPAPEHTYYNRMAFYILVNVAVIHFASYLLVKNIVIHSVTNMTFARQWFMNQQTQRTDAEVHS